MSVASPQRPAVPPRSEKRERPAASPFWWRLLAAGAAMAITAAFAIPLMRYGLNPYDEGVVALGAEQVLKGQRPNVDFYVPYPPGVFYVLAGLFRLAGTSLLVERGLAVACVIACAGLGCLLVTGLRPPHMWRALPECLVAGVTASVLGICMGGMWVTPVAGGALCLMLVSALLLRRAVPTGHPLLALLVGGILGLTMLWRSDFGMAALVASLGVWTLRAGRASAGDTRRLLLRRLGGAAAILLGAAMVAVPIFVLLVKLGGARTLQSLFVWPYLSTDQARLPWPPLVPRVNPLALASQSLWVKAAVWLQNWAYYFPCAALGLGAWRLVRGRARSATETDVALWLLGVSPGFLIYAAGRTDYIHLLPLLLISLLFAALCLGGALAGRPPRRSWPRVSWLMVGLPLGGIVLLALLPTPLTRWVARHSRPARFRMELPAPRGAGILAPYRYSRQYGEVIPYLANLVPPGEKLFSGTSRHDCFMGNDVMLYFLAERDPGTYFWCLDAGVTTTPDVQQQMLQELRAHPVNWAVRWTAAAPDRVLGVQPPAGAPALDQALATEFVPVEHFGWYEVLRRVSGGAPAGVPVASLADRREPG